MIQIKSKVLARGLKKVQAPALIVDSSRTVRAMNAKASQMTGLPAGEVVGKMTCRQVCQCRLSIADCPLNGLFDEAENVRRTHIEIAPHGRKTEVVERIRAFRDEDSGENRAAIVMINQKR